MTKKLEFEMKIIRAHKILVTSQENFQYSKYLLTWNNEIEKNYITKSSHIRFISHSLWRVSIIELCKLVVKSPNNHFNLFHMINFIEKHLSDNVEKKVIQEWRKQLQEIKPNIGVLKEIRDKIYAHTDEDQPLWPYVDVLSIETALNTSQDIIHSMARKISDVHLSKELPFFNGQILDIIEILSLEKENRLNKFGKKNL